MAHPLLANNEIEGSGIISLILREIPTSLFNFGLLLRQEPRKSDNVGVHAGGLRRRHLAVSI